MPGESNSCVPVSTTAGAGAVEERRSPGPARVRLTVVRKAVCRLAELMLSAAIDDDRQPAQLLAAGGQDTEVASSVVYRQEAWDFRKNGTR